MRQLLLVCVLIITLIFGGENKLDNFYKLLDQDGIVRIDINFFQKQFESSFNTSGSFYLIDKLNYYYDSPSFQILVNDSLITTINYETNQVVYSSIDRRQLGVFDILSGNKEFIEFSDNKNNDYVNNFTVYELGYSGLFEFDRDTGLLKLIKLEISNSQNILIDILSIGFVKDYIRPDLDSNKFEIVDLRD